MRKRPLLLALCVFWQGIAFRNYKNLWILLCFVLVSIYDFTSICFSREISRSRFVIKKAIGRSVMLLLIFLLGYYHMHQNIDFRKEYLSKLTDGDAVTVLGEIYKEEQLDETTGRIYLRDCYVGVYDNSIKKNSNVDAALVKKDSASTNESITYIPCNNIMVYTSSADFQAGIILSIKGQFHNFNLASNEGGFHSREFYQSQKIDFYLEAEEIEIKGSNLGVLGKWILNLKEELIRIYQNSLPQKWGGVMEGIVLGDKTSLDDGLKNLFTISGIVHILTVSGLHISVLGKGFYKILRNRRLNFLLSGIMAGMLLIGYGYLTGNGVSTKRAIAMIILFMLAQWIGRSYDMLNSLGGVCLLLLWENPFLIEYTGLWFSIMALNGVGWVGAVLSESAKKGKALWMSVGITLTTLPIVSYCYYEVPLYSPILNCIVIPLLTPVFVCGVFGGVIGLFLPAIGKVILYPCRAILSLYEWLCEWVGKLPYSNIITGKPPVWLMVVYYVVLGVGVLWVKRQNEKLETYKEGCGKDSNQNRNNKCSKERRNHIEWIRQARGLAIQKWIFVIGLFALLLLYREKREFEINFLDVGQGDGIHIAIQNTNFFIDGGSVDVTGLSDYRILPYLKFNEISSIDYWFVTHADTDHTSGLLEVIESGYSIEHLVLPEAIPRDENYRKIISAAIKNHILVCYMKAGDVIRCKEGEFRCLYPGTEKLKDRNEASFVLELIYKGKKALFTGDISSETEALLIEEGVLSDVWLYKAAHHGSKYSNSSELLDVIQPEISVISCSKNNVYGHPSLLTIERMQDCGSDIYYTMDGGQITIKVDRGEVTIYEYRKICQ